MTVRHICHAHAVRFRDAQFCECSAALIQKYIGLYLLTAAPSAVTHSSLYCDVVVNLLNYLFALRACSVHVAKC